jgi:hypothetical protein
VSQKILDIGEALTRGAHAHFLTVILKFSDDFTVDMQADRATDSLRRKVTTLDAVTIVTQHEFRVPRSVVE